MIIAIIAVAAAVILGIVMKWDKKIFLLITLVTGVCAVMAVSSELSNSNENITSIPKNEAGAGESIVSVQGVTDTGENVDIAITLPEREYSSNEKEELLKTAKQHIRETLIGTNDSLDYVNHDLVFDSVDDSPVTVEWYSDMPTVIGFDGKIGEDADDTGSEVTLIAALSLDDLEDEMTFKATVFPRAIDGGTKEKAENEIAKINKDNKSKLYNLPKEVDGVNITWKAKAENKAGLAAVFLLVVGILISMVKGQKEEEKKKNRQEELKKDYPELVSRLQLMLHAGIAPRKSFERMAAEYRRKKANGRKIRHGVLFEEVTLACVDMKNGIGEAESYEKFGERCNLTSYRTLAVMLARSIQRGSANLMDTLEQETIIALEERKRRARADGETASVKLLLPMGMMLGVVLIIIMVPSFLSL